MPSFRLDPYLWVHLAGLAVVPVWLDICLLGLAAGNPVLPVSLEITLLMLIGALPVVWMQWQKPFCIYSLVLLSLRPAALDEQQRKSLRLFPGPAGRLLALVVPLPLVFALGKLYEIAPLASDVTPFPNRSVGFVVAAIAFFLANLFLQVPVSVIKALLTSERTFNRLAPYPVEKVAADFTLVGLPVKTILPALKLPVVTTGSPVPTGPEEAVMDKPFDSAEEKRSTAVATAETAIDDDDFDFGEDEVAEAAADAAVQVVEAPEAPPESPPEALETADEANPLDDVDAAPAPATAIVSASGAVESSESEEMVDLDGVSPEQELQDIASDSSDSQPGDRAEPVVEESPDEESPVEVGAEESDAEPAEAADDSQGKDIPDGSERTAQNPNEF